MRIELIKKVNSGTKTWAKGTVVSVTNEYGQELIDEGKAVNLEAPSVSNETNEEQPINLD